MICSPGPFASRRGCRSRGSAAYLNKVLDPPAGPRQHSNDTSVADRSLVRTRRIGVLFSNNVHVPGGAVAVIFTISWASSTAIRRPSQTVQDRRGASVAGASEARRYMTVWAPAAQFAVNALG